MNSKREYNSVHVISEDIPVIFHPVPEASAEFQKRKDEVQEIVAQMILLGRKKGRPSKKEAPSEEAA